MVIERELQIYNTLQKGGINMIAPKNNVQLLNVKSVNNSIESFLNEKGDSSNNTRRAYEKDIKNFFMLMIGKELSQLTVHDLGFDKEEIIRYRTHLKELKKEDGIKPKYKNSSINRFIDSVRSLFIELQANGYDEYISKYAFHFKDLPETDSETAGELTEEEFTQFQETALQLENGLMKSLLIGLAGRTSFRLSALLKLTWSDISYINHGKHKGMWLVEVYDKGNKHDEKVIHDSFYKKLLEIKVEGQERLFKISDTAMNNAIQRICKLLYIDENRNISFHSLKGYGINVVIDNGGNVFDVKKQGNHGSIETSDKHYKNRSNDYTMSAAFLIDEEMNTDALDGLDKDQLLALIRGANKSVQRELMNGYKEGKHNV